MSDIVKERDARDPKVRETIKRNTKVAREAMELITKRNRKLGPDECFESVANTIGILCAELVMDAETISGPQLSKAIRELLNHHIDRAFMILEASKSSADEHPKTLN